MTESVCTETIEWKQVTTLLNGKAHTPRRRWGAAYCTVDDKLFISGGCCKRDDQFVYLRDAWFLKPGRNAMELVWEEIPLPPKEFQARFQHSATLIGDCIWLIGGQATGKIFNDIFTFNTNTRKWSQRYLHNPNAITRTAHAAAVCPNESDKILLFGGCAVESNDQNQVPNLVILDTKTLTVVPVMIGGDPSHCRIASAPAYCSGSKVYFIGGCNVDEQPMKGGASYNSQNCQWTEESIKCQALDGLIGARTISYQNRIYVYGGAIGGKIESICGDIIEITLGHSQTSTNINIVKSSTFPGRYNHVVFMFGDMLYTFQGKERDEGPNSMVYATNLQHLSQHLRQRETSVELPLALPTTSIPVQQTPPVTTSPASNQSSEVCEAKMDSTGTMLWLTIPLKHVDLAKTTVYTELETDNTKLKEKVEEMTRNLEEHKQVSDKSQSTISGLQQKLKNTDMDKEKLEKDLERKDKEITELRKELSVTKSALQAIWNQASPWKDTCPPEDRSSAPDPKRHRAQ